MGILAPLCVSSFGGRIYAFGTTTSYESRSSSYYLIQSNLNPSPILEDLSWTLISAVPTGGYSDIQPKYLEFPGFRNYDCTIDEKGVFSIVYINDNDNSKGGLQYQPSTAAPSPSPQPGAFGGGSWRNITFDPSYTWYKTDSSELFTFKDSQGTSTVMHAFFTNYTAVSLASLNPTTMTIVPSTTWTFGIPDSPSAIASNGKSIYLFGTNIANCVLYEFPLQSASAALAAPKIYNATDISTVNPLCKEFLLKANGDNVTIFNSQTVPAQTFTFGSTGFTRLPSVGAQMTSASGTFFATIANSSPVPFMYFKDELKTVYSIPLSGPSAGLIIKAQSEISIKEPYGSNPPSPSQSTGPISTWGSDLGRSDNHGGNTGAIVGGVCAAVVVVIAALGFVFYRRKRQSNRAMNGNSRSNGAIPEPTQSTLGLNSHQPQQNTGQGSSNSQYMEMMQQYPHPTSPSAPIALNSHNAVPLSDTSSAWEWNSMAAPSPNPGFIGTPHSQHSLPSYGSPVVPPVPHHSKPYQ
ncbi:hypothetical protein B0O80DRAFT_40283 [Mortierella sp. GBAus27b]|nr:hypothetical protein B0O80DRAFT_40283 [Mortierella sp. GBAus27b]